MKIGILGGGQLSRMLALSGIPLGFRFAFYEPAPENCVECLGKIIQKPYSDLTAVGEFIKDCDVITLENENIPVETAKWIAEHKPFHPNATALQLTQDRWLEKSLFAALNIPTVPFARVDSLADLQSFLDTHAFPVVIKKRRQGYDGKGQYKLNNQADLTALSEDQLQDCIVEQFIRFEREVSMIAVSATTGERAYYDICENVHRNGILHHTQNKTNDPMFSTAKQYIDQIIKHVCYIGCIAFEFFQVGQSLYANELAPRVHNSGHWTIEGAEISQFENHLRAIAGVKLGSTQSVGAFQMFNLLGNVPNLENILANQHLHLHNYQKLAKPGRKVGHVNIPINTNTQSTLADLQSLIAQ